MGAKKTKRAKKTEDVDILDREVMQVTLKEALWAYWRYLVLAFKANSKLFTLFVMFLELYSALNPILNAFLIGKVINIIVYSPTNITLLGVYISLLAILYLFSGIFFGRGGIADIFIDKYYRNLEGYFDFLYLETLRKTPIAVLEHPLFITMKQRSSGYFDNNNMQIFSEFRFIFSSISRFFSAATFFIGLGYWYFVPIALVLGLIFGFGWMQNLKLRNRSVDRTLEAQRVQDMAIELVDNLSVFTISRLFGFDVFVLKRYAPFRYLRWDINYHVARILRIKTYLPSKLPLLVGELAMGLKLLYDTFLRKIKVGDFTFLMGQLQNIILPLSGTMASISWLYSEAYFLYVYLLLIEGKISKKLYRRILRQAQKEKIASKLYRVSVSSLKGKDIQIKDLWFRYPKAKEYVLRGINMQIPYGTNVAIVGDNGAGKTTLLKLILGAYPSYKGSLRVGEHEVYEYEPDSYLLNFSILPQEFPVLPFLTVAQFVQIDEVTKNEKLILEPSKFFFENFFGNKREFYEFVDQVIKGEIKDIYRDYLLPRIYQEDIDQEKVKKVLEEVALYNDIKQFSAGIDTFLHPTFKNGVRPSTGQWQKLNIARILYAPRDILILDEPTSAIDPHTAFKIVDKLFERFSDRTVIIVSHRYSTIVNADYIYVLRNGKIIEHGTLKDLLRREGYFAKAYREEKERLERR